MRLDNQRYEDLKQEVANMFTDYNIKGVPINAFELAEKIGLTVIPYSKLLPEQQKGALKFSEDGFSIEQENQWIIYYNDCGRNSARINQTIMHEIAHYLLGHTGDMGPEEEAEAAFFAKYALVSPPLIHCLVESKTMLEVKDYFEISYEAARIAIGNYQKWKYYGPKSFTKYELQILKQLDVIPSY